MAGHMLVSKNTTHVLSVIATTAGEQFCYCDQYGTEFCHFVKLRVTQTYCLVTNNGVLFGLYASNISKWLPVSFFHLYFAEDKFFRNVCTFAPNYIASGTVK
jgi:hypothetical protein